MSGFTGVPLAALDFYEDLEADNSRSWWTAHKETYDEAVRAPMTALGEALEDEFGPGKLFRPYRDVRFSRDKTPYKTHQGLFVTSGGGTGFYVQVSAAGLMTAAGMRPDTDGLRGYREAVDAASGAGLQRLVDALRLDGFHLDGDVLATRPRGTPAGHPRVDLLRHKSLFVRREHGAPGWLATPQAADRVRDDWRRLRPLVDWLADACT
jgi:uncharacterized protein (TIGR02453 family)